MALALGSASAAHGTRGTGVGVVGEVVGLWNASRAPLPT